MKSRLEAVRERLSQVEVPALASLRTRGSEALRPAVDAVRERVSGDSGNGDRRDRGDGDSSMLDRVLPGFVRESYMRRFAAVVLVIVAVTTGLGLFFQQEVSGELEHEATTRLEGVAAEQATALERWITEHRRTTSLIARADGLQTENTDDVAATLAAELQSNNYGNEALHYVDTTTGEVLASATVSMGDAEGSLVNGNVYDGAVVWRTAADDGGELEFASPSDVVFSEIYTTGGQGRVAFATPVPGTTDRALVNVVSPSSMASSFRSPYEGARTEIVDLQGNVQIAANTSMLGTAYTVPDVIDPAFGGESGVTRVSSSDEFVAYAPVWNTKRSGTDESVGWAVAVHVPASNALAVSSTVSRDVMAIIGVSLLGFVVLGLTLGRNTVQAIRQVSTNAEAIAAGDLDAELDETDRRDEIGDLIRSFRSMQSYLTVAAEKAEAVAEQRFDDPVLDREIPGAFGQTIDEMAADVEQSHHEVEAAREEAQDARAEAEDRAKHLQEKAAAFSATMTAAAEGDLTSRMDPETDSEAMAEIATAFNEMMADLEGTVADIHAFADEVAEASDDVTVGTRESTRASEQVSDSIQEITAEAETQSDRLSEVAGEMQSLSGTVEEVASSADEVARTSDETAAVGREGQQAAAEAMDEMSMIEHQSESTVEEVETLADEIGEIGDVVELIADIADQTNMLALNASIEAARAGEAGEGFAVVADEIKGLAGEVAEATEEVESLIGDVQASSDAAVADIREMGERVRDGTETIEEALAALEEIAGNVEAVNTRIQEISDATDDQATSTEEVASMIDDVADAAEGVSEESENVSAAAEEQTSTLTEVASNAQRLSDRAEQLQETLDSFTVGADESPSTDPDRPDSQGTAADGGTIDD